MNGWLIGAVAAVVVALFCAIHLLRQSAAKCPQLRVYNARMEAELAAEDARAQRTAVLVDFEHFFAEEEYVQAYQGGTVSVRTPRSDPGTVLAYCAGCGCNHRTMWMEWTPANTYRCIVCCRKPEPEEATTMTDEHDDCLHSQTAANEDLAREWEEHGKPRDPIHDVVLGAPLDVGDRPVLTDGFQSPGVEMGDPEAGDVFSGLGLEEGMRPLPEGTDMKVFAAVVDLLGKVGATEFEVAWDDEKPEKTAWSAHCMWQGAGQLVRDCHTPENAAMRLARKVINGTRCTSCARVISLSHFINGEPKITANAHPHVCFWSRMAESTQFTRGCIETHEEHAMTKEAIRQVEG